MKGSPGVLPEIGEVSLLHECAGVSCPDGDMDPVRTSPCRLAASINAPHQQAGHANALDQMPGAGQGIIPAYQRERSRTVASESGSAVEEISRSLQWLSKSDRELSNRGE